MSAIEVNDLAMAYGELRAVDGVSFTVQAGKNDFDLDLPKVESGGGQKPPKK